MDLVRNVLGFAPGGAVVVHINGLPQRHLAAERVRAAPLRAAGALVNSARLAVRIDPTPSPKPNPNVNPAPS